MGRRPLDEEVSDVMQRLIEINERWPGDYALHVQTAATPEGAFTHYEWYFKPPSAGAGGDMARLAERPPGYADGQIPPAG